MSDVDLGVQLELELQQWNQNINTAIRAANNLDDALDSVIKQANDLQKALNAALGGAGGDLKFAITVDDSDLQQALDLQKTLQSDAGFKVVVDESEIEQADTLKLELDENAGFDVAVNMEEIDAAAQEKMGLESNVNFAVAVDDAELERARRAYEEFEASVTVTVNVSDQELDEAKRTHDALDNAVTTTVNVGDAELDEAKRKRDDLGGSVSTEVEVDDSEIKSVLEQIRDLQTIDVAFTVGGAALGVGQSIFDFTAGGILEMNDALLKLEGTTGQSIPGARELIENLYTNAWGESRSEITKTIGTAQQFGIAQDQIQSAVTKAYELSSVTGYEAEESLRTLHTLVTTGLAPDYEKAGDIVVSAFQEGADRGGDLLEALFEYAPNFSQLKLSGEGAANAIVGGIDAGFMNADVAGDSLRELSIKIFTEWGEETQNALKQIDYFDETEIYKQGGMGGDEWLSGLIDALSAAPAEAQQPIAAAIFGTTAEDFSAEAIKGLDPLTNHLGDVQDRLANAATTVNGDLQTALTELKRTIEVELGNAIDTTFDIQGLIDKAKEAVILFADEIQAGEGIFGAAEVALKLPGLEDTMQELQQIFANIGIGIMQALSSVLDTLGQETAAASIDKLVADMAGVQLDIEIGTSENFFELQDNVNRALSRGVTQGDLLPQLISQFNSAIESGDFNLANAIMHEIDALEVEGVISVANLFDTNQDAITDMADALHIAALSATGEAANRIDPSQVEEFANALMSKEGLYDTLHSNLSVAVDEAIANSDLARLTDLSQVLGADGSRAGAAAEQLRGFYESAVTEAFANLDLTAARENLDLLGDQAPQSLVEQADQLAGFLEEELQNALDRNEPQLALDYAKLLGNDELIQQVQTMVDALHPIEVAFSDTYEAARGSVTQNMEAIAIEMGDTTSTIKANADIVKEGMAEVEIASRISTEAMGESFKLLATDADESFTAVDETTGETAEKMGGDSEKMKDSVIGTAGELLLQSLAMGLSFLAISTASENTERRTSDAFGMMQDNMLDTESVMVDSLGVIRDEFTVLSDSILTDAELLDGTLLTTQDYAVTWADVLSEEFAQLSTDFSIMVDSIQTNGGRLMDTLTQLSADIKEVDLSVEMSAPSSGDDSSGGDAETVDAGETINGMARVAIQTATADELKARDGYFVSGIPGDSRTYFYENGKGGYWSSDTKDGLFTYRPPKNLDNGGVVNEEAPESPYTTGADATAGLADYLNAGGAAATTTAPSTGSTSTSSGSTSSGGPTSTTKNQVREWTKLIDDYTSDAVGYYEDFVESFETETEKLTGVLADLMMIQQIQIPSELLALASVQNNSSTSIQNNVNFYNQNAAAAANSAVNAGTALRGFGG